MTLLHGGNAFGVFEPEVTFWIGHVVTTWSLFEAEFSNHLSLVCRAPAVASACKAQAIGQFRKRTKAMAMAYAVAVPHEVALHQKVQELCDEAAKLAALRNQIVHGFWMPGMRGEPARLSMRKPESVAYRVTAENIQHLDEDINKLHNKWGELWLALTGVLPDHVVEWLTDGERASIHHFFEKHVKNNPGPEEPFAGIRPFHR